MAIAHATGTIPNAVASMESEVKWLRKLFHKSIDGIGFCPALISLGSLN